MRTLLLPLFSLLTGNRLVLQAMSCVMAEWIDTGLSELKASVVSHGFFWMRLTDPPGVAVAGHAEWPPTTREMVVRGLTTRRNPRRIPHGIASGVPVSGRIARNLQHGGTSTRFARDVLADESTERATASTREGLFGPHELAVHQYRLTMYASTINASPMRAQITRFKTNPVSFCFPGPGTYSSTLPRPRRLPIRLPRSLIVDA
jgi:hypothetical protein